MLEFQVPISREMVLPRVSLKTLHRSFLTGHSSETLKASLLASAELQQYQLFQLAIVVHVLMSHKMRLKE